MTRRFFKYTAIALAAAGLVGLPPGAAASGQSAADPTCKGKTATLIGDSGKNALRGTNGRDVIVGGGGVDRIRALGGNDLVCGGRGADRVYGGDGSDRLFSREGNDYIAGGSSSDRLEGGSGNDVLRGEGGPMDGCFGGSPRDDKNAKSDFADKRSCEKIRSARGVVFLRANRAGRLN